MPTSRTWKYYLILLVLMFLFPLSTLVAEEKTTTYTMLFEPKLALIFNINKEAPTAEGNINGDVSITILGNIEEKSFLPALHRVFFWRISSKKICTGFTEESWETGKTFMG